MFTAWMMQICRNYVRKDISRIIYQAEFKDLVKGGETGRKKRKSGQSTRRAVAMGEAKL